MDCWLRKWKLLLLLLFRLLHLILLVWHANWRLQICKSRVFLLQSFIQSEHEKQLGWKSSWLDWLASTQQDLLLAYLGFMHPFLTPYWLMIIIELNWANLCRVIMQRISIYKDTSSAANTRINRSRPTYLGRCSIGWRVYKMGNFPWKVSYCTQYETTQGK